MATTETEVYCTLLTSDDYLPGAMVLAHSLRDNGTKKRLAILVTMEDIEVATIEELKKVYDYLIPVRPILNKSPANLYLMHRPDLISTFTKIELWRQTQFSRIVYLDADTVALKSPDELFAEKPNFAAVPDIGWPDCFNSGVLVLTPNMGDYYSLLALAQRGISFDGADQGLLNMHFPNWHRLSFTYNCTPSGNYQYVPAYRHYQSTISMVHFIGTDKPWSVGRDWKGATGVYEELLGRWWAVYDKHYRSPAIGLAPGPPQPGSQTVQQYVTGETSNSVSEFPSIITPPPAEASAITTEPPLSEPTERAEALDQGAIKPTPTAQQRRFSVDWDPIHHAPPANSRPEAANFPTQKYLMSTDRKLFQPPSSYPEPPKNLSYQIPSTPPATERPKMIFPWEAYQTKATRVFSDDPRPTSSGDAPSVTTDATSPIETASPATPTIQVTSSEPWGDFRRANAWDEMPEIERYIANLPQNRRRAQLHARHHRKTSSLDQQDTISSPGTEGPPLESQGRRPSLRLTDFPTEIERPSLPVTPAPMRRPSFWGQERDAAGELPPAEGVPDQADWDPLAKLYELQKKQTEMLNAGPSSPRRHIPDRSLPPSSQPLPTDAPKPPATTVPEIDRRSTARALDTESKSREAEEGSRTAA
ncbi:MAG: hypothetical protein LQ337_001170 [Flavoplaca oasis]|nr:MAG: hypothetical protein LQ337_001170 [Flavoplaca oasis]